MIREIQQEIMRRKAEKNICILAHSYQAAEILEVADHTGDSFQLSLKAKEAEAETVILCGVRFMAETVKILSPQKKVWLANPMAGCPMAEQMDRETISRVRAQYPDHTVVAYINTTAELKTVCDVCVTSSSAVKIVKKLPSEKILFIPDCNLGDYVAKQIPEKQFRFLKGGCPVHAAVTAGEVRQAKSLHPNAEVLVHPECAPAVTALADYAGSTSGIMEYAKNSPGKEFIIGTEISIAEHLQYACPDKTFTILSKKLICSDMKATTLMDLYNCVRGRGGEEIRMDPETIRQAGKCIDEMIRLG